MATRKAVGIDLGTTFSAVAHIDAYGKPQIIPNSENERITPSVILFDDDTVIVGTLAKNSAVAEPEKIVDFVKREIGKPKETVDRTLHRVISFEPANFPEEDGRIVMRVKRGFFWRGKLLRPEEVIAKRFG